MGDTVLRRCTRCGESKSPDDFFRDRQKSDGIASWCKECKITVGRIWRHNNAERDAATKKAYRAANPHVDKIYQEAHREQRAIRSKAWRLANAERVRDYQRAWQRANPKKVASYARKWLKENPEKSNDLAARRRARQAGAPRVEKIDRDYIYERDGGLCHLCRKHVDRRGFHLDHLVPLSRGGSHTHDNLALAHPICNMRRHDGCLPAQLLLVG